MSEAIAERALRIALESPSSRIKIEFQGGEPLLNFPLITKIVENAKLSAPKAGKKIEFVIASNLALLTDDILAFCKRNEVLLSTSLDGPADLHNRNRPRPGGNSYELAVKGIMAGSQPPITALGLKEGGMALTGLRDNVKDSQCKIADYPDALAKVKEIRDQIVSGALKIDDPMMAGK